MKSIVTILIILVSTHATIAQTLPLSTNSDSAKYFYYQGWNEVMNHGNYSASEAAYRKMYAYDSSFVLGQALLGRISDKPEEQKGIITFIESNLDSASTDEQLVIELFTELIKRRVDAGTLDQESLFELALTNLGLMVKNYDEEDYYFAEYIEWINAARGPKAALDSINKLASASHHIMPFIIGYKVHLNAEIGQFDNAQIYLNQLENQLKGKSVPKVAAVKAALLLKQEKPDQARLYINRALAIDPKNLDVLRLQKSIKNE
jgi:tetratricopeptide (TPR) repeat protein